MITALENKFKSVTVSRRRKTIDDFEKEDTKLSLAKSKSYCYYLIAS